MEIATPTKRARLDALTGVRFFAALHVVIYHEYRANLIQWAKDLQEHFRLGDWMHRSAADSLAALISGVADNGAASVALFFILSGFILAYTYLDRTGELTGAPGHFYINRFARIYPTYLLGILLATPFEIYHHTTMSVPAWGRVAWTGFLNITLLQAWFPPVATSWNAPGWSLSVEALFYISFPFIGVALMRGAGARREFFVAGAAVITILALGFSRLALGGGHVIAGWDDMLVERYFMFFPIVRLPEFILGIALGRWFSVRSSQENFTATSNHQFFHWLAPLAAIGIPIVLSLPLSDQAVIAVRPTILAILFAALICGLAVNSAGRPGIFTRFLSLAPLMLLGEASYAIYIIHVPIGKIFDLFPHDIWVTIAHAVHLPTAGFAQAIGYFSAVLGAAIFVFRCLENPSRRWLRKRLEAIFTKPRAADHGNVVGVVS